LYLLFCCLSQNIIFKKITASIFFLQFCQMIENTSSYLKLLKSENVKNGSLGPFCFVATICVFISLLPFPPLHFVLSQSPLSHHSPSLFHNLVFHSPSLYLSLPVRLHLSSRIERQLINYMVKYLRRRQSARVEGREFFLLSRWCSNFPWGLSGFEPTTPCGERHLSPCN
jgi:hypothetical protein